MKLQHVEWKTGPSRLMITLLPEHALADLMDECGEEPADFKECKPCFAYLIYQVREAALNNNQERWADLMKRVQEVFAYQRDSFGEL